MQPQAQHRLWHDRSVGLTYLTAKAATGTTSLGSYPITLLGRLVNHNFPSQELVRTSGAMHSLLGQLQVSTTTVLWHS